MDEKTEVIVQFQSASQLLRRPRSLIVRILGMCTYLKKAKLSCLVSFLCYINPVKQLTFLLKQVRQTVIQVIAVFVLELGQESFRS